MAEEIKVVKAKGVVREGAVRVEILNETYVPAEGGHQKVLAGSVVDVPALDAEHLIKIGKAKVALAPAA